MNLGLGALALLISVFLYSAESQTQSTLCADTATYCSNLGTTVCSSNSQCGATCNTTAFRCSTTTTNCSGTTPYCLISGFAQPRCVECTSSSQCTNSSRPICDRNNVCVGCQLDSDCTTKADCGATCASGFCVPSNLTRNNCSNYTYGGCFFNLFSNQPSTQCSGECIGNTFQQVGVVSAACKALYSNKSICHYNQNSLMFECVQCDDSAQCVTDTDCRATCVNNVCVPSNIAAANCTNQSLYCNDPDCVQCTTDDHCVVKLNRINARCRNNVCLECARTGGGGGGGNVNVFSTDCIKDSACGSLCTPTGTCTNATLNCTANGTYCSTSSNNNFIGKCVECNVDSQCLNGSRPFCDQNTFTCVQCLSGANCPACGATCSPQRVCTGGTVCSSGRICSNTNGGLQCVGVFNGCTKPCDNSSIPFCDDVTDTCVQCLGDSTCRAITGLCSATCNRAGFCVNNTNLTCTNSTPVCDGGTCVECLADVHCQNASRPFCDTGSKTCRECLQNRDCQTSSSCSQQSICNVNGTCTIAGCNCTTNSVAKLCSIVGNTAVCVQCLSSTDCSASAPYCTNGKCTQCVTDANCQSTTNCLSVCSDGNCKLLTSSPVDCTVSTGNPSAVCQTNNGGGRCLECTSNSDCTGVAGKPVCNQNNKCVACTSNNIGACISNTNCDAGCVNFTCVSSSNPLNCGSKYCLAPVLNQGQTARGSCVECTLSSQCPASKPYCSTANTCGDCQTDAACQTDSNCNARCDQSLAKCVPAVNPLNCTATGRVCASGVCANCSTDSFCLNKDSTKPYCVTGYCSECRPSPTQTTTTADTFDCRTSTTCNASCIKSATGQHVCDGGNLTCTSPQKCFAFGAYCVNCTADSDCPTGKFCSPTRFNCVDCKSNSDCISDSSCGASCVGGVCASAPACPTGKYCRNVGGTIACVACRTAADCPSGEPCSPNGVCGICSSATDCRSDTRCGGVQCIDNECTVTNSSLVVDCTASGKKCSVSRGSCVQCLTNTECGGSTPNCVNGQCVQCTSDSACRNDGNCNAICNSATGNCENPVAAKSCSPQVCNIATGACTECTTNANCDSDSACGRRCVSGRCTGTPSACSAPTPFCSSATCVECTTASQCGADQTCNAQRKCVACTPATCPAPTTTSGAFQMVFSLFLASFIALFSAL